MSHIIKLIRQNLVPGFITAGIHQTEVELEGFNLIMFNYNHNNDL